MDNKENILSGVKDFTDKASELVNNISKFVAMAENGLSEEDKIKVQEQLKNSNIQSTLNDMNKLMNEFQNIQKKA